MSAKQRLDVLLVERGLISSRELARRMIMAGEVTVNSQTADKPGVRVALDADLAVRAMPRFVSRGGDKLEAAITAFDIPVAGKICADVGASTGGFTDCLLQHGAAKVYAIDVGYGQIDYRLRQDARVIVIERTNARYVESLPDRIDLVTIDASFISLRLLLPVIRKWLAEQSMIVALIKPQFEAGRDDVGKGGVVRQPEVHQRVLQEVITAAQGEGFTAAGLIRSPLKGPAGNIEFLIWLVQGIDLPATPDVESLIVSALGEP